VAYLLFSFVIRSKECLFCIDETCSATSNILCVFTVCMHEIDIHISLTIVEWSISQAVLLIRDRITLIIRNLKNSLGHR